MFYTIVIRDTQAIFGYQDADEAVSKFHAEMKYGYDAKIRTVSLVLDQNGHYYKSPEIYDPDK